MNKQNFFKWLKRGILVLAIIPILLFLGFAGAVSLIDFNQYKPQIEQEVAKATGRVLKIEGAVDVSVLPFMFNIGQMYLRNKDGFTEENLLSIHEVQIELSLAALFMDKKISVISLELIEPKLHLTKTAESDNWSDIQLLSQWVPALTKNMPKLSSFTESLQRDAHPQTASEWFESLQPLRVNQVNPPIEQDFKSPGLNFNWAFDSLVIRQGELQFENQKTGVLAKFSAINVLTFDVVKGQPFDVSSEFTYQNGRSLRTYDFHLNSTVDISEHFQKWKLTDWSGLFTFNLPVEENVPAIRLTTSGELLELDLQMQNVNVVKAKLMGLEAELTSSFSGLFGVHSALQGTMDVKGLNFKSWAYHLGLPLPEFIDQKALTEGNGQFDWQWDGKKLFLEEIKVQVDQTQLQGSMSYQMGKKPILEFDLNLDKLNLETYLAKYTAAHTDEHIAEYKNQTTTESARPGEINLDNTQPSPMVKPTNTRVSYLPMLTVKRLRNLTASGQLSIGQLNAWDINPSSLQLILEAQKGVLSLAPLDAEIYKGQLRSKLTVDLTQDEPEYHWKGRLQQVDLATVNSKKNQVEQFILEGRLNSYFDVQSAGLNDKRLKQNLKGLFSSEIEQLKIQGFDVNQLLNGALEMHDSSTLLENVYLSGSWQEGVYTAKQLLAKSARFSGNGSGTYDLNSAEIDSLFLLNIENPTQALSLLKGVTVPVSYQGSLQAKESVDGLYEKARWEVDMTKLMASPAYQPQQKQLLAELSSLLQ